VTAARLSAAMHLITVRLRHLLKVRAGSRVNGDSSRSRAAQCSD